VRVPQWTEGMTAGAGWIALAIVVFASWRPGRVLIGAYLFGGITVLQLNLQAAGAKIPVEWLSMSPYLITILVLVMIVAADGRPLRARLAGPHLPRLELRRPNPANHPAQPGRPRMKRRNDCLPPAHRGHGRRARRARPRAQDDPLKVGFIYVGPIGDGGWTYQHDQGGWPSRSISATQGRDDLPGKRARGRGRRARDDPDGAVGLRADLHHLLRLHGRHHQRGPKFPDVKFEHATGYKRPRTSRPTTRASTRAAR
jgi:hypothetical protein